MMSARIKALSDARANARRWVILNPRRSFLLPVPIFVLAVLVSPYLSGVLFWALTLAALGGWVYVGSVLGAMSRDEYVLHSKALGEGSHERG